MSLRGRSSATPTSLPVKRGTDTAAGTGFLLAKESVPNSGVQRHGIQNPAVSYGATSFIGSGGLPEIVSLSETSMTAIDSIFA